MKQKEVKLVAVDTHLRFSKRGAGVLAKGLLRMAEGKSKSRVWRVTGFTDDANQTPTTVTFEISSTAP
jgi:hypothetical protein